MLDERPQVGDGHVGTQERRLLSSAGVRVVLLSKKRGIQTVDLFGARVVCSKLVERGWVDAFQWVGRGRGRIVDDLQHQDEDAHHVGFVLPPLFRLARGFHGLQDDGRWRGLHCPATDRPEGYGELRTPVVLRSGSVTRGLPRRSRQKASKIRDAMKIRDIFRASSGFN